MTTSMLVALLAAGGLAFARLIRASTPLLLAYLALRRTRPPQRAGILLALTPVLQSYSSATERRGSRRTRGRQ